MKFSIIIPTFNSERYIRQCLESIKKIDYPKRDFETIIADGGSKDNTIRIAKEYNKKIIKVPNLSISQNRNIAAKRAGGKFLVFLDSDCKADRSILKRAEKHLKHYACCGSFYRPKKRAGWIAKTWLLIEKKKKGKVSWIPGGTLILKKDTFKKIKGFNQNLATGEDYDLCYRLRKAGHKIYNDPKISSVHLGQTDNIKDFLKKEMWRGNTLLKSIKEHGILKQEIPSTAVTLYHFFAMFLPAISLFTLDITIIITAFLLLMMPSSLLAVRKIVQTKKISYFFKFWAILFIYQIARASSIIRYNQLKDFF